MFIRFISLEELMRWVLETDDSFYMKHLWFPKFIPIKNKAARYAFMKNIIKH